MKRVVGVVLGLYLAVALANRLAERAGLKRCGCADDCWCKRPGLSLFRWVFPWRHRAAHAHEEKAELDRLDV